LKAFGAEGIGKLEGMFAFVFIDIQSDEILLCIDRFGIKPLYYYEDEEYFIASSEIKGITGSGLVEKKVNTTQIRHYLLYKYAKPPETFFKQIFTLQHGTILQYHNNQWRKSEFSGENIQPADGEPDSLIVEEMLTGSLLQQLNANVPMGLLLSGGVDSTLLLALAKKEGFTLPSFSIINSREESIYGTKDYRYARLAASRYGSDHTEMVANISLLDQFPEFISQMDQPIGDSSYLMTRAICERASTSMKILLSGAGADELFAGYNRHWAFYKFLGNQKLFDLFLPSLKKISGILPSGRSFAFRKRFRLMKKFIDSYDQSSYNVFQNYITFHNQVLEDGEEDESFMEYFSFGDALEHDRNNYLVHDVLALSDRASMSNSIELRVPYLNEKLSCYLNSFPAESRIKHGKKWLLKEILLRNGGKVFNKRPKEGFGLPLTHWLLDEKAKHLWEIFDSGDCLLFEYFDRKKFDELVREQRNGKEDHGPLMWSLLVLAHWLKSHF
jgi:asparagine synthase (glutamine-hydrolysing)